MSGAQDSRSGAALAAMCAAGSVGGAAQVTDLKQLDGGWSRHTWALSVADPDVGALDLIVRVRPRGALLETDLGQEFRTYELLAETPVPSPHLHGMDADPEGPFGGPFFVMERLPGSSPNVWRPRDRRLLAADWEGPRSLAADLVETLAAIHAVPAERLAGAVVERDFAATLDHWQSVQHEKQLVADPVVEEAYAWARERAPDPPAPRLVHGDYRIGNCLIDGGRLSGVLDWELSFVGDPRFDLGYVSLDYHAGKFAKPGSPLLNAVAERDWFYRRYAAATGLEVDREVVDTFSVVGLLMLFAILVTGIREYSAGSTEDIRMAWTRFALPGLRQDMIRLMRW
jgi:aminoglycoside phosphotransferase (APT) family kinase protein